MMHSAPCVLGCHQTFWRTLADTNFLTQEITKAVFCCYFIYNLNLSIYLKVSQDSFQSLEKNFFYTLTSVPHGLFVTHQSYDLVKYSCLDIMVQGWIQLKSLTYINLTLNTFFPFVCFSNQGSTMLYGRFNMNTHLSAKKSLSELGLYWTVHYAGQTALVQEG